MIKIEQQLKKMIEQAARQFELENLPDIVIETPKQSNFGDKATNFALTLTRQLKKNPREIANSIVNAIDNESGFLQKMEIAGPGFINFYLNPDILCRELKSVQQEPSNWGKSEKGNGQKVIVEFVSANPTGPLTIGHGRQAVLGDTLSRILEWTGYEVDREYYFNNAGRQMRVLGNSLKMRALQLKGKTVDFPDDHYQGEYLIDIARKMLEENPTISFENESFFKDYAEREIFSDIRQTLNRLNINFKQYFNEKDLYDNGKIEEVLQKLKDLNLIYEKDNAVWFKTTEFGAEKDRVLVKNTGEPTYRLPDIAYHTTKFERGYDWIIDLFGADHVDTYPDVINALNVLGYPVNKMRVLIHQFVTLYQGKELVKMSTRRANFVTLDELMDEVGEDVTRYFFIMRSMDSHLNFDLELARKASDENPVFYNQYAHARICSILRKAKFEKNDSRLLNANLNLLNSQPELALIKSILEFPKLVQSVSDNFEIHRIPTYLESLAQVFHKFYTECRVMVDYEELKLARLALCDVTRQTMENGLAIIGISAPDKM